MIRDFFPPRSGFVQHALSQQAGLAGGYLQALLVGGLSGCL
jgi:hypothetical protein